MNPCFSRWISSTFGAGQPLDKSSRPPHGSPHPPRARSDPRALSPEARSDRGSWEASGPIPGNLRDRGPITWDKRRLSERTIPMGRDRKPGSPTYVVCSPARNRAILPRNHGKDSPGDCGLRLPGDATGGIQTPTGVVSPATRPGFPWRPPLPPWSSPASADRCNLLRCICRGAGVGAS